MNTKNLFRPFPLVFFFIALLAMTHFFPQSVGSIIDYLHDPNIDDSKGYLSLYYIVTLVAIAYIPTWSLLKNKDSETVYFLAKLLVLGLFPIVIGFSQWLWEFLGWILMGCFLFMALFSSGDNSDEFNGGVMVTMLLAFVAYLGFRIFSEYKGLYDILLVSFYGLFHLSGMITKVFVLSEQDAEKYGSNPPKMVFYNSVPVLLFLFFAGLWGISFLL